MPDIDSAPTALAVGAGRACGLVENRELDDLGLACDLIAPTMISVRAGDRVKSSVRNPRSAVVQFGA